MQKKIIEFTNLLRKSGIRVSVAEGIDAFNALDELSLDDREVFQDALRSSMVKRGDEIPTFDELFNLFWSGFYDNLKGAFGDMEGDLANMGIDLEQLLSQLAEMMENMDGDLDMSELAQALLTQDLSELENMIRAAAEDAGTGRIENMLQVGFFSRRTTEQLGLEGAQQDLENLVERMKAMGMGDDQIQQMQELIRKLMETVRHAIRNFTERELRQQNHATWRSSVARCGGEELLPPDGGGDPEDARGRDATRAADQEHPLDPQEAAQAGKLDLHETLRRNMAAAFPSRSSTRPAERTDQADHHGRLVVRVSRFMLRFMYSLQGLPKSAATSSSPSSER